MKRRRNKEIYETLLDFVQSFQPYENITDLRQLSIHDLEEFIRLYQK